MKKQFVRFAAVTALAAGTVLAQAPATPAPQTGGNARVVRPRAALRHRLMTALNLTDAQKQQAKAIFQDVRQQAQPIAAQLKQNRQALTAAVKADNTAEIQTLAAQQGTLRGQLLTIRSDAMAKFYAGLTPDQRAKADQFQQRVQQRMQQRIQQRKAANNG